MTIIALSGDTHMPQPKVALVSGAIGGAIGSGVGYLAGAGKGAVIGLGVGIATGLGASLALARFNPALLESLTAAVSTSSASASSPGIFVRPMLDLPKFRVFPTPAQPEGGLRTGGGGVLPTRVTPPSPGSSVAVPGMVDALQRTIGGGAASPLSPSAVVPGTMVAQGEPALSRFAKAISEMAVALWRPTRIVPFSPSRDGGGGSQPVRIVPFSPARGEGGSTSHVSPGQPRLHCRVR
jgi:hypothetical protein